MHKLLLLGLCLLMLGNLLHIVGLSTIHWQENDILVKTYFGLFKGVLQGIEGTITEPPSSLEATRALCIIGFLLGGGAAVVCALFLVVKSLQSIKIIPLIWLGSAVGGCGFILLGCIIFSAECMDHRQASLGYSFILSIIGALAIGGGGFLAFIGGRAAPS